MKIGGMFAGLMAMGAIVFGAAETEAQSCNGSLSCSTSATYTFNQTGNYVTLNVDGTGSGEALYVLQGGSGIGVYASDDGIGTGSPVEGAITNSSNSSAAVDATTEGTGGAIYGEVNNSSNDVSAIEGTTNGSGAAIYARNTGTGYGVLATSSTSSSEAAVYADCYGTGPGVEGVATSNVGGEFQQSGTHGSISLVPVSKLSGNCPTSGEMYMSTEPHLYVCLTAATAWSKVW
jgi:hypothetical protein